ncbi:sensor histidine kinase [Haliangium sp.]|uniref:sensor histidine kinase n=1 Tax=Haliangium sp. TaxID=2663208 RepID=UPI003D0E58B3
MRGGNLFQRLMLRFAVTLLAAFVLLIALIHVFQIRTIDAEWQEHLQQEASWLAMHVPDVDRGARFARAWAATHRTVRLTVFDQDWNFVADSLGREHVHDLLVAARGGRQPDGHLMAAAPLAGGGWLIVSHPATPGFPQGVQWPLIGAVFAIICLAILAVYPLTRSLSVTFEHMREMADDVASGHFGRTLALDRRDQPGELGALIRSFDAMSQRLAEAEKLNTRLLHDVSHELRSPLGRIQVMAQTIEHRPEAAEECVAGICEEVALLDRLVGDLLQTAQAESLAGSLEPVAFELDEWARATFDRLERRARAKEIDWVARVDVGARRVQGDPQRLTQAVTNLVDNAINALAEQSGDRRIEVSVSADGERWSLGVRDNGPGVPREHQAHVFRRFYRVHEHRDRDRGGVGLGLSLVQAIVAAHGGEVSLESPVGGNAGGEGTEVVLRLPHTLPTLSSNGADTGEGAS